MGHMQPLPVTSCASVTLGRSLHVSEPHRFSLSHLPRLPSPNFSPPKSLPRMSAWPSLGLQGPALLQHPPVRPPMPTPSPSGLPSAGVHQAWGSGLFSAYTLTWASSLLPGSQPPSVPQALPELCPSPNLSLDQNIPFPPGHGHPSIPEADQTTYLNLKSPSALRSSSFGIAITANHPLPQPETFLPHIIQVATEPLLSPSLSHTGLLVPAWV